MKANLGSKTEVEVIEARDLRAEAGELGAIIELTVKDREGHITERRLMRSRSFVRQFLELLWVQAFPLPEAVPLSIRDTGSAYRDSWMAGLNFNVDAGLGNESYGIIIGSGTTAPAIDDYCIETIIPHATMNYSDVVVATPTHDATTAQFTITRDFSNVSGGTVTVNELALYVRGTSYYYMAIRDVVGGGISVPDGQTLTINYRIQATV